MQPQVFNGSRATLSINGDVVAAAFVSDYTIETRAQEIETIDDVFPAELAPERIRVNMSLKVYRTPDNDPIQERYAPGAAKLGTAEQTAFLSKAYIYVEIKDRITGQTIFHIPKAWLVRRSGSVQVHDFLTETWSIIGLGYFGPTS